MEPKTSTRESAAQKYLRESSDCRDRNKAEFLSKRPRASQIVDATNELVASLFFFLVEKDLDHVPNAFYIVDLLVSFCRSHFVAMDLIVHAHIIEGGTILRKQMEVMGRLKELRAGMDISELAEKTPKVTRLPEHLRRLYGDYSGIAHSSAPKKVRLLGVVTKDGVKRTPLYPVFDDNMYVALLHIVLVVIEFALWARAFFREEIRAYNGAADRALLDLLVGLVVLEYPTE